MQYKVIKPITIDSLIRAGGNCEEFKENLNIFINMDNAINRTLDLWEEIDIVDIVPCFRYYPIWEEWLVEKCFIEVEGMTYHVGQYFTHPEFPDCVMSISRVKDGTVNIIAHNFPGTYADSNRLTMEGVQVDCSSKITTAEMCKMTGFTTRDLGRIIFCNISTTPLEG